MKRILGIALALSLTVAVGSASAHHNGTSHRFGWHHHHHHGFFIAGTNASFNGTKNDDGTYTGHLTLTLKWHHHSTSLAKARARAAHHNVGDTNDSGTENRVTKTFHLDNTAVRFSR